MLAHSKLSSLLSQKFSVAGLNNYLKNRFEPNCNILLNLSDALVNDPSLAFVCADETAKLFKTMKINIDNQIFNDNYAQLAKYGVLFSSMVYGYDITTQKFALYTSSVSILKQLRKKGILVGKKENIDIELQQIELAINNPSRIKTTLKKGGLVSCRLDLEMRADRFIFTPTGTKLTIDTNKIILVPAAVFESAMEEFNRELQDSIFRIYQGDKVRVITKNTGILSNIYGEDRTNFLLSQQYNVLAAKFYAPVVGASVYTSGVTQVKLTDIAKIERISPNQLNSVVDLSEINLDLTGVKSFFMDSVVKMPEDTVKLIAETYGVSEVSNKTIDEVLNELRDSISTIPNHELWALMKASNAFDIAKYKSTPSKFGTNYTRVEVPQTKEELDNLLKTGIFKILSIKRDGTYSTVIGTNNQKYLNAVLGKDFLKYESEGVRLRNLAAWLNHHLGESFDFNRINDLFKNFYLESKVPMVATGISNLTSEELLSKVKEFMANVEDRTTVMKQPHLSVIRNLEVFVNSEGVPSGGYYRNIDIKTIVEIIKLS